MLAAALGRDISDRITLVANNDTGLGINEDFYIESEHHVVRPRDNTHTTRWTLSEVNSIGQWTLGTAGLGNDTRLVY